MDFGAKLKIAAGRRLANRGGISAPPIGTWERVGWDEWHAEHAWDRQEREERASQAHITTGYFTPIGSQASAARSIRSPFVASIWKAVAAFSACVTLYLAVRYVLQWV